MRNEDGASGAYVDHNIKAGPEQKANQQNISKKMHTVNYTGTISQKTGITNHSDAVGSISIRHIDQPSNTSE